MDNLAMMAGSIGQPKVRGKRLERAIKTESFLTSPGRLRDQRRRFRFFVIQADSNQPNSSCFLFPVGITGRYCSQNE